MENIEIEYVFSDNKLCTLDEILIYILNSKISMMDFKNEK